MRLRRRGRAVQVLAATIAAATIASCSIGDGAEANRGADTALIALVQEPGVLSPLFSSQSGSNLTYAFVVEPMFLVRAGGKYEPYLAAELPTEENGGVSKDGRTITLKLRKGIRWSDGTPMTANDLKFTVDVIQNANNATLPEPEYAAIKSTKVVDDRTLKMSMSKPTPGYLNLFKQILPKHEFDSATIKADDPQVRMPLGTGPFVYEEWSAGDQITLRANEEYWRDPDLPKLDGINIKVTPDEQATLSGFTNGEYDSVYFINAGDLADLTDAEKDGAPIHVSVDPDYTGSIEWLWLNHTDNGDPNTPHPVTGDPAVRHAMDAAIDRQAIIDDVLGGFGVLEGSFVFSGFGAEHLDVAEFDPDSARSILDAAGWVPGDDGVRVKDGVRASLKFQTISGDQTRSLYQQIIQQNLKDIGIEVKIENVPSDRLFGSFADDGLLTTGNFDISMSRAGREADPGGWLELFSTRRIPSDDNPNGFSYTHWSNAQYDKLERKAATTIKADERRALIAKMNDLLADKDVAIPLYAQAKGDAWSSSLTNVSTDFWDGKWTPASSAHWTLER